jgi:urease accessory protein
MHSISNPRSLALAAAAGLGLSLLSALPAGAHGLATAGLLQGIGHPLLGLDHLLLLLGVGASAASIDSLLLAFALAGAVLGALFGASGGNLPAAELLAAMAVVAVGLLLLLQRRRGARRPRLALAGGVIGAAVAIHAMLHGHEAPAAVDWWLGAGVSSAAVVIASFALLQRLPEAWTLRLALLLCIGGGMLALVPAG